MGPSPNNIHAADFPLQKKKPPHKQTALRRGAVWIKNELKKENKLKFQESCHNVRQKCKEVT